jgi:hypothetical protein
MSEEVMKKRIGGMLRDLEASDVQMDGLDLSDLKDAMSHPNAPALLAEWMPHEETAVKQGEPAPDFTLPFIPGHALEGETMTLSSHFGKRPVGLIFGSYT